MMKFPTQKELEESRKEYDKFMDEYKKKHELCPKCGSKGHSSTLMGYVFNSSQPENYKDLNRCVCSSCGNNHTAHERISIEEFKK